MGNQWDDELEENHNEFVDQMEESGLPHWMASSYSYGPQLPQDINIIKIGGRNTKQGARLSKIIQDFPDKRILIIGASSSLGKSTHAHDLTKNIATLGLGLEMDKTDIARAIATHVGNHNMPDIILHDGTMIDMKMSSAKQGPNVVPTEDQLKRFDMLLGSPPTSYKIEARKAMEDVSQLKATEYHEPTSDLINKVGTKRKKKASVYNNRKSRPDKRKKKGKKTHRK